MVFAICSPGLGVYSVVVDEYFLWRFSVPRGGAEKTKTEKPKQCRHKCARLIIGMTSPHTQ